METSPFEPEEHEAPDSLSTEVLLSPAPPLEVVGVPPATKIARRPGISPSLILVVGAILVGLSWYLYNVTLPPKCKGLISSDAEEYVRFAKRGFESAFTHASHRTFGYLTFLALIRELSPTWIDFLIPATLIQVTAYFASCLFLVFALRKTGLNVPSIAVALVLAHPGIVSISALALTDSLATSLLSCALGVVILITHDSRSLALKSIGLGLLFGVLCSMRPSFNPLTLATGLIVSCSLWVATRRTTGSGKAGLKAAGTFATLFALTLAPFYAHLIRNCYSNFSQVCIVDPEFLSRSTPVTLQAARDHARFEIYIKPNGGVEFHPTLFPVLKDCRIDKQSPFPSLLDCYARNASQVPFHFYTRLIGLFDARRLNFFSIDETTPTVYWTNRAFSIAGFFGIVVAVGLTINGITRRRPVAHLAIPILYLCFQLIFHNEYRYSYPVTPLLFLLGISALGTYQYKARWQHICVCGLAVMVACAFVLTVLPWDAANMRQWGHP